MKALLWDHPAYWRLVEDIEVEVERVSATLLRFRYRIEGDIDRIVLPPPAPPLRTDNLWRTTCFEAFLMPAEGQGYRELNFSPSSQWAVYEFTSYRDGMAQGWVPAAPDITLDRKADVLELNVAISLNLDQDPYRIGLAAVIEGQGGEKAYWATGHGSKDAPDFHHPACFALELPPPPAP